MSKMIYDRSIHLLNKISQVHKLSLLENLSSKSNLKDFVEAMARLATKLWIFGLMRVISISVQRTKTQIGINQLEQVKQLM
jgi:hypothetical protein